ncbi:unnamed protein product [Chrysoparadoxa australica]
MYLDKGMKKANRKLSLRATSEVEREHWEDLLKRLAATKPDMLCDQSDDEYMDTTTFLTGRFRMARLLSENERSEWAQETVDGAFQEAQGPDEGPAMGTLCGCQGIISMLGSLHQELCQQEGVIAANQSGHGRQAERLTSFCQGFMKEVVRLAMSRLLLELGPIMGRGGSLDAAQGIEVSALIHLRRELERVATLLGDGTVVLAELMDEYELASLRVGAATAEQSKAMRQFWQSLPAATHAVDLAPMMGPLSKPGLDPPHLHTLVASCVATMLGSMPAEGTVQGLVNKCSRPLYLAVACSQAPRMLKTCLERLGNVVSIAVQDLTAQLYDRWEAIGSWASVAVVRSEFAERRLADLTPMLLKHPRWMSGDVVSTVATGADAWLQEMGELFGEKDYRKCGTAGCLQRTVVVWWLKGLVNGCSGHGKGGILTEAGRLRAITDCSELKAWIASVGGDASVQALDWAAAFLSKDALRELTRAFVLTFMAAGGSHAHGLGLYDLMRVCLKLRAKMTSAERRGALACAREVLQQHKAACQNPGSGTGPAAWVLKQVFPEAGVVHSTGKRWSLEKPSNPKETQELVSAVMLDLHTEQVTPETAGALLDTAAPSKVVIAPLEADEREAPPAAEGPGEQQEGAHVEMGAEEKAQSEAEAEAEALETESAESSSGASESVEGDDLEDRDDELVQSEQDEQRPVGEPESAVTAASSASVITALLDQAEPMGRKAAKQPALVFPGSSTEAQGEPSCQPGDVKGPDSQSGGREGEAQAHPQAQAAVEKGTGLVDDVVAREQGQAEDEAEAEDEEGPPLLPPRQRQAPLSKEVEGGNDGAAVPVTAVGQRRSLPFPPRRRPPTPPRQVEAPAEAAGPLINKAEVPEQRCEGAAAAAGGDGGGPPPPPPRPPQTPHRKVVKEVQDDAEEREARAQPLPSPRPLPAPPRRNGGQVIAAGGSLRKESQSSAPEHAGPGVGMGELSQHTSSDNRAAIRPLSSEAGAGRAAPSQPCRPVRRALENPRLAPRKAAGSSVLSSSGAEVQGAAADAEAEEAVEKQTRETLSTRPSLGAQLFGEADEAAGAGAGARASKAAAAVVRQQSPPRQSLGAELFSDGNGKAAALTAECEENEHRTRGKQSNMGAEVNAAAAAAAAASESGGKRVFGGGQVLGPSVNKERTRRTFAGGAWS